MNPIYKFTLAANGGDEQPAFPVYRDDLAKDFELQTNQEFYRAKLSGKLTFVRDDYDFIANKSFDTQFGVKIYISYDAGITWTLYWSGNFWKTNCTFNADDKNVTLTPDVVDQYTDVLAGMEKEYNLIELAPEIVPVHLDKRPMIQVYVPGQTVIGCFLSGMWWEQECESITDENQLEQTYFFAKNKTLRVGDVSGTMSPQVPDVLTKTNPTAFADTLTGGGFALSINYNQDDPENAYWEFSLIQQSTGTTLWYYMTYAAIGWVPITVTLSPVSGTIATGSVTIYIHDIKVFARRICDVLESTTGLPTQPIPADDMVENNRNYTRVIPYEWPETIAFNTYLSETPTQWGIYQPGKYYMMYTNVHAGIDKSFPIARSAWGRISIWFAFPVFDYTNEKRWRKKYTLRDAYPLASVISVLLAQFAPGLTHAGTTDYSQFLYGTNPLMGINQRVFITPKSNMISLGYDQPAQKAPVTLKRILDMLRDCFRCYWFVDEQNRFRIEHIEFFRRGGAYTGTPVVGRDLTTEQVTRNGKKWAFGASQFEFDKPEMAARYQFGWMDDVTELFDGNPIDIVSKYANPGNIEQIEVSQFTSDVDYILLNPGEISKDGFVLLSGIRENLVNLETITERAFLNTSGQVSGGDSGYCVTDYIPVSGGNITSNAYTQLSFVLAYAVYDINKTFLRGSSNNNTYVYRDGDAFVRFTFYGSTTAYAYFDGYTLSYLNIGNPYDPKYSLQNGWVSFYFLQQYYFWDMPARYFKYNGEQMAAQGIKKLKTQTLKFPAFNDPNTLQLIKTNLGNGTIQKMSVNLSSRNANTTLKYDTE